MTRTLGVALGIALGAITLGTLMPGTFTMAQAQQPDSMSRSRGSAGSGLPGLGGSDGSSGPGSSGPAIPGGSTFSTSKPGGTIPMGAASQSAPRRPSLGPDLGPDLKDSLTMPRD